MNDLENTNENSTIQQILIDIDRLLIMLNNESDSNISMNFSSLQQMKQISSLYYHSSSSTTITNVTINDHNNNRLIEHLHHRINRLEHERNILLTSYQLLIKLLK